MTALVILAAGASNRLGRPKQNLLFHDSTLLQIAIKTALRTEVSPIIVVLGANADAIVPKIDVQAVKVIYNPDWSEGMASSIRVAVEEIEKDELITDLLVMLCDQPFVSSELLRNLVQKKLETGKAIVACAYNDTVGVPTLFDRSLFPELLALKGNEGAKNILKKYVGFVEIIPFEKGSIDIDTKEDYERLIEEE